MAGYILHRCSPQMSAVTGQMPFKGCVRNEQVNSSYCAVKAGEWGSFHYTAGYKVVKSCNGQKHASCTHL